MRTLCLALLLVVASPIRAAMPGRYPGLEALAAQSGCIAIVTVGHGKDDLGWMMNGGVSDFPVTVDKVLFGPKLPKKMNLLLICSLISIPGRDPVDLPPFLPGSRYLVFLTKEEYHQNDGTRWMTHNIDGALVPVAPDGNLAEIDRLPLRDAVALLRLRLYEYKVRQSASAEKLQQTAAETDILLNTRPSGPS